MQRPYATRLFRSYSRTHLPHLGSRAAAEGKWFRRYVALHYAPALAWMDRQSARILEIGCSKGYLLNALYGLGYRKIYGVDLSETDLASARDLVPAAELSCVDALAYLAEKPGVFQGVIAKAVLEHLPKDSVLPFLERVRGSLSPRGVALIEVPNMNWLFASHERYMDFTHETGFTPESLGQVLRNVFPEVEVHPLENVLTESRFAMLRVRWARRLIGTLIGWAEPQAYTPSLWARSLLGVARRGG